MLIDRHVVKMPSESCIMLANCYSLDQLKNAPKTQKGNIRGHAWQHHGCTKWAKSHEDNFFWLLEHATALCDEYSYRHNKDHFCRHFTKWCWKNKPQLLDNFKLKPYLAMPDQYKGLNPVESYIKYYCAEKRFDKLGRDMWIWTKRNPPEWSSNERLRI